jgi:endoglycosylceramidase
MSVTDKDLMDMRNFGFKLVRVGVMWEAVETAPGVYDMEYLDKVEKFVNRFAEYGIHVMLDNHQDMFSRKLCGNGVPHFYTPELEHEVPNTFMGKVF